MSEETRLLNALRESGIKRVAVVDDAFDPPTIPDDEWGGILAHIRDDAFVTTLQDHDISKDVYEAALEAIEGSEFDSEVLDQFISHSFGRYVTSNNTKLDLGGQFSRRRGPTLEAVRPVLTLLEKAGNGIQVVRIGSIEDEDFAQHISEIDLVFADFYLDPETADIGEDGNALSEAALEEAKRKSQRMLQKIIEARGKVPSIVLMSSRNVATKATDFRKTLSQEHGQVVASRFQFLEKNRLNVSPSGEVEVMEPASDALLDILQTFQFSEGVSLAVKLWKSSAKLAIDATAEAISDLQIRDFAYLIRFRLEKEGQDLVEYMEWLLGEYLIDQAGSRFYTDVNENPEVRRLRETQSSIEGAYDGSSPMIASIYHHVRVEDQRPGRAASLRMGDLFLDKDRQKISAIITPDCDLVVRKGATAAKRLTVVNGTIEPFDRKHPSATEFIVLDGAPKNIKWDKKDIETHGFKWASEKKERSLIGTLRPMYAQQLQRAVVHDVGRVGLAPWPALYLEAEVELWYVNHQGQKQRISFAADVPKMCVVMPRRPDAPPKEQHEAIFTRTFIRKAWERLGAIKTGKVLATSAGDLAALQRGDQYEDLFKAACRGVQLGKKLPHNILVTNSAPPEGTWAWLKVNMS